MKAIIHCGGKGTRLPEISNIIPKPMVEINNKPLLHWQIENLKRNGITDIYITLHHLPEKVTEYFGNGEKFGVNIKYFYEKKLLGTGGALRPLIKFLDSDTLILYGDIVMNVNFKKLLAFHKLNKAVVTAVIHPSLHPEDSDLVEFDKKSKLIKIKRKPHVIIPKKPFNLAALYVMSPKIAKYLKLKPPFDIAQNLLPEILSKKGSVFCYNTKEFMMDIGTPQRLLKAKKILNR